MDTTGRIRPKSAPLAALATVAALGAGDAGTDAGGAGPGAGRVNGRTEVAACAEDGPGVVDPSISDELSSDQAAALTRQIHGMSAVSRRTSRCCRTRRRSTTPRCCGSWSRPSASRGSTSRPSDTRSMRRTTRACSVPGRGLACEGRGIQPSGEPGRRAHLVRGECRHGGRQRRPWAVEAVQRRLVARPGTRRHRAAGGRRRWGFRVQPAKRKKRQGGGPAGRAAGRR